MLDKIKKAYRNPEKIVRYLNSKGTFDLLSDEQYIRFMYFMNFKKKLNLHDPKTFNEKMQWLKLYNRNPEYTQMVDKYEVKKYVARLIGERYIIPTLGVWDSFDQIDFNKLPEQFVLKCTHDSGGIVICKDKKCFDVAAARKKLNRNLKVNYYMQNREWPYRNVKPRIIAEKYMTDESGVELKDYKFFCFGGVAKCFKVDFDRFIEHHANYYDMEKNQLDFGEEICPPVYGVDIDIPGNLESMKELAEKLSVNQPFLRADFYNVSGQIYFGELTFYPASGFGAFTSNEWDVKLGEWIRLPEVTGGGGIAYCLITSEIVIFLRKTADIRETIDDESASKELNDYKLWCFNGEPKLTLVCTDRFSEKGLHEDFFDMEWKHLAIRRPNHPNADCPIPEPSNYKLMQELAGILSRDIPFVRVDFYEINNCVYFGEITFFPASGFEGFESEKWETILGSWIDLSVEQADSLNLDKLEGKR